MKQRVLSFVSNYQNYGGKQICRLTKASNSLKVLENIPPQYRATEVNFDDEVSPVKTLGVLWLATDDVFTFKSYRVVEKIQPQREIIQSGLQHCLIY